MAEYIEREALLKELKQSREWHAKISRDFSLLVRCENIVREQTSADVAPVRHGRWLYEPKFGSARPYHCSLPDCGASYSGKSIYCPNCGARMDGDG